jgi:hypothetical protein
LPNYDEDRVYPSDIKKILNWYGILQSKGLLNDDAPATAEEPSAPAVEEAIEEVAEKPAKKAKAKKE